MDLYNIIHAKIIITLSIQNTIKVATLLMYRLNPNKLLGFDNLVHNSYTFCITKISSTGTARFCEACKDYKIFIKLCLLVWFVIYDKQHNKAIYYFDKTNKKNIFDLWYLFMSLNLIKRFAFTLRTGMFIMWRTY